MDFKDPRLKKKAEFEEKQYEVEKQNHINNLLNENIFRPLRKDMIEILDENSPYTIPLINFDPSGIRKRDLYTEGIKHLKCKIDNFEERFKEIENDIREYNYGITDFEDVGLINFLSEHFGRDGFYSNGKIGGNELTKNTIILRNLTDALKRYWKYDENFELKLIGDFLYLNGRDKIALIDPNDEHRLLDIIYQVKNHKDIINKYEDLKDRFVRIINKTEFLKEIRDKLVLPMDLRTYVP